MTERRIGGTEISKLLGLSKYGGPRSVFDRIVLGIKEPSNPRAERGIREEPRIRGLMVERLGLELEPHPGVVQHPRYEFASVSPDDLMPLELIPATADWKSVTKWARHQWGPDLSDAVPEHIGCQLQWAMEVTDRELALVGAAFGEDNEDFSEFRIDELAAYVLRRDREMAGMMLEVAERFWVDHILTGIPPPPDPKPKRTKKKTTTQEQPHD